MTDEEALKLAITFEEEFPQVFKDLERIVMLSGTAMDVTRRIQEAVKLNFSMAAQIRAAMMRVHSETKEEV